MLESQKIYIPYEEARPLIQEADLLLYRGHAWYSNIIKKITRGQYSHVGMASWHNGHDKTNAILETIEFHGGEGGGVTYHMSHLFPKFSGNIDIYRVSPSRTTIKMQPDTHNITYDKIIMNTKNITHTMRELTGLPYGWRRIWWFVKSYLFGFRFFYDINNLTDDQIKTIIYPVCSTAISYCFDKNNFDLLHEKADEWTSPSDLAASPLTNYLFTII